MKQILTMSIATLLCVSALSLAQQVKVGGRYLYCVDGDKVILIKGRVAQEMKNWLVIEAHNADDWKQNGFDPSYTRLIADYQPLIRKLPNGEWEIMFTSEIARDIP